jgi:hypothetical protein
MRNKKLLKHQLKKKKQAKPSEPPKYGLISKTCNP